MDKKRYPHIKRDLTDYQFPADLKKMNLAEMELLSDQIRAFLVEKVARTLREAGFSSFIINAGGNVRCVGKPLDGRDRWGVGIQDPEQALLSAVDLFRQQQIEEECCHKDYGYDVL